MNEDVERFLEECRTDPFFQNNPNGVDRIEDLLLTRFYHEADESLWDRMRGIITRKAPLNRKIRGTAPAPPRRRHGSARLRNRDKAVASCQAFMQNLG
jgi:hypothetical protein